MINRTGFLPAPRFRGDMLRRDKHLLLAWKADLVADPAEVAALLAGNEQLDDFIAAGQNKGYVVLCCFFVCIRCYICYTVIHNAGGSICSFLDLNLKIKINC